ncbi:bet1-like SNARE 1-2 isoform X1 [Carica papaya]|uniref:bet1-like SNARE 1-2 isoform X1 n=1 Tax=Carica papaya TaxID=3649 RepID=UPI000B8CC36B|nr:bet1-like SNARE 1-2 isoform X1 [Carica papaya]
MSYRREHRASRTSLFDGLDGLEEGRVRASSSYSHEISEPENDKAMDNLQDRVSLLKRLTGDIHEEVESHNRMLDRMGNNMDASRGVMSVTMDRFKMGVSVDLLLKQLKILSACLVLEMEVTYIEAQRWFPGV